MSFLNVSHKAQMRYTPSDSHACLDVRIRSQQLGGKSKYIGCGKNISTTQKSSVNTDYYGVELFIFVGN